MTVGVLEVSTGGEWRQRVHVLAPDVDLAGFLSWYEFDFRDLQFCERVVK